VRCRTVRSIDEMRDTTKQCRWYGVRAGASDDTTEQNSAEEGEK
jgi:hypothetical protein